jgi:ubiquinone/menaquinone biosynthesis C-methylase UbiE
MSNKISIVERQAEQQASSERQSKVFLEGEGDGWFNRNKSALTAKASFYETDIIERVLAPFKSEISSVLEIGCSNGAKLQNISAFFDAEGFGVDPSAAAVADGNEQFAKQNRKGVHLQVSTAAELPFVDASFDLVYFGFCLYLVDRSEIFKAVSEADRVLKPGGFLAILDFDPAVRHKRAYVHKPGVFSFKTCYADFFTAGGHYYLVAKESFSHSTNYFSKDSNERVSVCILHKEMDAY